mgnify:CR=1 FL=1
MSTKFCKDCQIEKSIDEFPKQPRNKDGLFTYCRSCNNARTVKSPNYKLAVRKAQLKKNYGITPEDYDLMFAKQQGVCAICSQPDNEKRQYLCVDHDHASGVVRGLLCHNCNIGLGKFQDDPNLLNKAIWYLGLTNK